MAHQRTFAISHALVPLRSMIAYRERSDQESTEGSAPPAPLSGKSCQARSAMLGDEALRVPEDLERRLAEQGRGERAHDALSGRGILTAAHTTVRAVLFYGRPRAAEPSLAHPEKLSVGARWSRRAQLDGGVESYD